MTFDEWWTKHCEELWRMDGRESIDFARAAWNAATKAERERCAGLCDDPPATDGTMSDPNEVVGHKTLQDEGGRLYYEPLTRAEADALWAQVGREQARRESLMSDEAAAIQLMMDAHTRLKDFGWKDAIYCPKDGSTFHVLEAGSTGIHLCSYMGEWPKGDWWIESCPSRPILYRPLPSNV